MTRKNEWFYITHLLLFGGAVSSDSILKEKMQFLFVLSNSMKCIII